MNISEITDYFTEENIAHFIEQYRSFGPLPGILLTFLKSFIPPLPTIGIVGVNAAIYGLWPGFFYSWIGIVSGCMVTFLIARAIVGHRLLERWAQKPKVAKRLVWIRRNAFSYVFLLSLFPVGPFVIINIAAGVAKMRVRSFFIAVTMGKAVMVFSVSYIGHDLSRFVERPLEILYVLLFVAISLIISKRIEAYFARKDDVTLQEKQAENQ
ncbi:TVP38/TMEM64 family protein [Paenibacillus sp. GCM10027626]|uniref:TVP38/TMEM64 family protein n=1 Tax=Paenibacillus sp. GCM10027626 TaxID=3273411 RepID=UPI0036435C47